jgi:photosystem II stability/assembly factor-like uncharacterized protein
MFAVGSFGLLRSTDGGQTFSKVTGKAGSRAYSGIDGGGGSVAVAFGPKTIALTVDGKAWKLLKRPKAFRSVQRVDFVSKSTGYALASDGRLWRTDDSGKHWREIVAIGTGGGYRLSFGTANRGWVAVSGFAGSGGGLGWLMFTSDGGKSWRPQLVDNRPVFDVAATSGTHGFVLTDSNRLFHTYTGGDAASPSKLTLTAKGLTKHRVRVTGKLSPGAAGGARVAVSWRVAKETKWAHKMVTTDSAGRFGLVVRDHKSDPRIVFVAQWTGNQKLRSAGSKTASAKPKKPKKPKSVISGPLPRLTAGAR